MTLVAEKFGLMLRDGTIAEWLAAGRHDVVMFPDQLKAQVALASGQFPLAARVVRMTVTIEVDVSVLETEVCGSLEA